MTVLSSPRRHLLLPWTVQEREDPVLEFERGEGVYFYDRHGRRYLDFLSQLFNCNLGHGNRRVIEAITPAGGAGVLRDAPVRDGGARRRWPRP